VVLQQLSEPVVPSFRQVVIRLRPISDLYVRARLGFCDVATVPATRRPMSLKFWTVRWTLPMLAPTP